MGSCSAGSRATEQQRRGDQAQDGEPGRRSECGLVAGALRNVTILTTPHSVSPGRSPAVNRQLGYTGVLVTTRQHRHGVQLPERGWHDWADDGQRADRGGPAGAAGPGPGLPGRAAAGGPYGNGRGRWSQLARRGSRSASWPRRPGWSPSRVHQLVAGADLDALGAVLASCGQRAGQPPRIQAQGRHRTRRPGHQADRLSDEVSRLRQCTDCSRTWTLTAAHIPGCRPRLPPMWAPVTARPPGSPALTRGLPVLHRARQARSLDGTTRRVGPSW